jgi:hypothetical protein
MSRPRIERIRARRERLLERAQNEREVLAGELAAFAPVVRVVDGGIAAVEWVRRNPEPVIAVALVVAVLRPRRAFRWALRGFSLWQGYRRVSALLARARG